MRIKRNERLCYYCKSCQLACSFHHTGTFWPDKSSISVYRNPVNGETEWRIDSTCDQCSSEKTPLCVKYCTYGALEVADE
ncbi:MAG TPA: 4Fe-4S ferredoxin [Atribacterota bacterium]|nr:4Fe-4S ferredoxin [Atribacterota bacterium]